MPFVCKHRALLAVCWTLSLSVSTLLAALPGESPLAFGAGPGESWFAYPATLLPESPPDSPLDFAGMDASLTAAREVETVHERLAETGRLFPAKKSPPAVLKATWPERRTVCAGPVFKNGPVPSKLTLTTGSPGGAAEFRPEPVGAVRYGQNTASVRADYFSIRNGYNRRAGGPVSFVSRPSPLARSRFSILRSSFYHSHPPGPFMARPGVFA